MSDIEASKPELRAKMNELQQKRAQYEEAIDKATAPEVLAELRRLELSVKRELDAVILELYPHIKK